MKQVFRCSCLQCFWVVLVCCAPLIFSWYQSWGCVCVRWYRSAWGGCECCQEVLHSGSLESTCKLDFGYSLYCRLEVFFVSEWPMEEAVWERLTRICWQGCEPWARATKPSAQECVSVWRASGIRCVWLLLCMKVAIVWRQSSWQLVWAFMWRRRRSLVCLSLKCGSFAVQLGRCDHIGHMACVVYCTCCGLSTV